MSKCRFKSPDGHCTKWRKNGKCRPSDLSWCDEPVEMIQADRMCEHGSIFGNYYFYITDEQIESLKKGEVAYTRDEYGVFLALKKEATE